MVYNTQEEAKNAGSTKYFTGQPCKNGHIDFRYTNTGICYECKRQQAKRDYSIHKERAKSINKKSAIKHKDRVKKNNIDWRSKNRAKSNAIKKRYRDNNIVKCRKQANEYSKRKRLDPYHRLNRNTSKAIWASLKGEKGGRKWQTFVSFTLEELQAHLESKFKDGMTWENYGKYWELDHIKPLDLCSSFEEAWQLSNLQPLESSVNRSKCNRYIG